MDTCQIPKRLKGVITAPDKISILIVTIMGLFAAAGISYAGLTFHGRLALVATIAAGLVVLGLSYIRFRPSRQHLGRMALYNGLWLGWSLASGLQSYVAASWAMPLRDDIFNKMDLALGFDWIKAFHWNQQYPALRAFEEWAYGTYYLQAFFCIGSLALWSKPLASCRFLVAATIAFLITNVISGIVPSLGPAEFNHYLNSWGPPSGNCGLEVMDHTSLSESSTFHLFTLPWAFFTHLPNTAIGCASGVLL